MYETLVKLAPIFIGFAVAFTAKKLGWVRAEFGTVLLKTSLYVTIPALILVSVSRVGLTRHLLIFPLLSYIVVSITFVVTKLVAARMRQAHATEGTFRVAPMTMNSAFSLPFLLATFGSEGVTRVVLFNAGFNPLLLLGVYGVAASYNPRNKKRSDVLKRVLFLPPLWALIAGVVINLSGHRIPSPIDTGLAALGALTGYLTIFALGLLFNPTNLRAGKTIAIVGLRMGIGLLVGGVIVVLFKLHGVDRAAVLALAAGPVGFNLLTFAAIEHLDRDLAASAVSLSMLIGLVLLPIIVLLS
jgi:predicted permease